MCIYNIYFFFLGGGGGDKLKKKFIVQLAATDNQPGAECKKTYTPWSPKYNNHAHQIDTKCIDIAWILLISIWLALSVDFSRWKHCTVKNYLE